MTGFYIIGVTLALVLTLVRLRDVHEELARMQGEHNQHEQDMRDDAAAYAHSVLTLACLLAQLAAASWSMRQGKATDK